MALGKIFWAILLYTVFCVSLLGFSHSICYMEFTNLQHDVNCDCVKECTHNANELYALKTMDIHLTDDDFISYWERGRRDKKSNSCHAICRLKAQSISIMNDETRDEVKDIYMQLFPLTPAYIKYLSIIRFKNDCGVTKPSPSSRNPHHYDFYKCDEFKLENVELISSVNLHEENV